MIVGKLIRHSPTAIAPWGSPACRAGPVLQPDAEGWRCQLSAYSHDELSRLWVLTGSVSQAAAEGGQDVVHKSARLSLQSLEGPADFKIGVAHVRSARKTWREAEPQHALQRIN